MAGSELGSFDEFFSWCTRNGLDSDRQVAEAFSRTTQTVRNWKKLKGLDCVPPIHMSLACSGYDAMRRESGQAALPFPQMTMAWFSVWRSNHGLDTLDLTGAAFGLTRQAVHNWIKRGRLPSWLPLACRGYEEWGRTRNTASQDNP